MNRKFWRALQFLTILPVPSGVSSTQDVSLASSALFFPVTGLVIALLSFCVYSFTALFWPPVISVLFLLVTPIVLSGGLHFDGLSDMCDGFFSGRKDPEKILEIMKDSRIGVMGALGVGLTLLFKYQLLIHTVSNPWFFFFALSASRTVQVVLGYALPYVGGGLGSDFVGKIEPKDLFLALGICLLSALPLGFLGILKQILFLLTFISIFSWAAQKKIGGVTGDVLGAASELTECGVLLIALMGGRG